MLNLNERPKLLKIADLGKAKVLAIHLGQYMDPCKWVKNDYKVYISCVCVCMLYPDNLVTFIVAPKMSLIDISPF